MKRMPPPALFVVVCFLFAAKASATTYYIAANGSDSNNGTSESAPWGHLPGMATWTGSHTPIAGDTFVLRGCDVWTNTNFPINWTWSGSSGSLITITRDTTWYNTSNCPSSWNRAVFNAGGTYIGGVPDCTAGVSNIFLELSGSYVFFSWIEATGLYWSGTCGNATGVVGIPSGSHQTIDNWYVHGWSHGSVPAVDMQGFMYAQNGPNCSACTVQYTVFDGSDTDQKSGGGVQSLNTVNNIFKYMVNAIKPYGFGGPAMEIGGNDISYIGLSFDGQTHPNCIETIAGSTYYVHDNYIHNVSVCEGGQLGNSGEIDYVWNNIWVMRGNGANPPQMPQAETPNSLYFWNNIIDGPWCMQSASHGYTWSGTVDFRNNYCINSGAATPSTSGLSAGTLINTNNVGQTEATANGQGYTNTETYVYSPISTCTSSTCATLRAGTNLTSVFPTGTSPSGRTFTTNDMNYACSEETVSGVVESVCPARTWNSRPTGSAAWDAGVYHMASGGPPPPTGLVAVVH